MLDSYARKVTLERRTAMFEKSMIEFEKRKHFEAMVRRLSVLCLSGHSLAVS